MISFLMDHWSHVVLRASDGDIAESYLFVRVRDQNDRGEFFEHTRKFKITALEEIERETRFIPS